MKRNIKSRKNKNDKKGRKSYKKRGGGCGCGKTMGGGTGYYNMQSAGQVPYSYNNQVSSHPQPSNYGGNNNNASLYQSGMGGSISGGSRYRKKKNKNKNNKRRTMKGGMINWSNQTINAMDPFMAATGTPMSSVFYTPSNYVPPAPMA